MEGGFNLFGDVLAVQTKSSLIIFSWQIRLNFNQPEKKHQKVCIFLTSMATLLKLGNDVSSDI